MCCWTQSDCFGFTTWKPSKMQKIKAKHIVKTYAKHPNWHFAFGGKWNALELRNNRAVFYCESASKNINAIQFRKRFIFLIMHIYKIPWRRKPQINSKFIHSAFFTSAATLQYLQKVKSVNRFSNFFSLFFFCVCVQFFRCWANRRQKTKRAAQFLRKRQQSI